MPDSPIHGAGPRTPGLLGEGTPNLYHEAIQRIARILGYERAWISESHPGATMMERKHPTHDNLLQVMPLEEHLKRVTAPADCPNCSGQREWAEVGKVATCVFCGTTMPVETRNGQSNG